MADSAAVDSQLELRTPLPLPKIALAFDEPDSAPALVAALRSDGEETDRLSQPADDLLLLASADPGALRLRTPVRVADVLDTIATRFARAAARSSSTPSSALATPRRAAPAPALGLAIIAAIAQAHGGTASAANAPGCGAEVTLTLPASI